MAEIHCARCTPIAYAKQTHAPLYKQYISKRIIVELFGSFGSIDSTVVSITLRTGGASKRHQHLARSNAITARAFCFRASAAHLSRIAHRLSHLYARTIRIMAPRTLPRRAGTAHLPLRVSRHRRGKNAETAMVVSVGGVKRTRYITAGWRRRQS